MSARVLVLHPGSFIGAAVVRRLAASGWAEPVVAATDGGPVVAHTNPHDIGAALRGCVGIVNCVMGAGSMLDANTHAVAAALRDAPQDLRVVHVSSMSVYGNATGLVSEDAPLSAEQGDYAAARIASEAALRAVRPDAVILRPGIEYGAGGWLWSGRIAKLLAARRLGDLGPGGDGCCNLVHVDDVALAAEQTLRVGNARGGTFNLAMDEPPTWNEYLVRYALALRAVPVRRIGARRQRIEAKALAAPLKVLEIAAGKLGVAPEKLPPPVPGSLWRLCRQDIRLDVGRAARILGMVWRPLGEGLEEAAHCYRAVPP